MDKRMGQKIASPWRANQWLLSLTVGLLLGIFTGAQASDHADPIQLTDPLEPDLTGLFAFPDGDALIVALNSYRGLTFDPPYNLQPFEFRIHLDWQSVVSFDQPANRARYGGTVVTPQSIKPTATIALRLDNNAGLLSQQVDGLQNPDAITVFSGVRDDPFIFPRFFGTNVISMVVRIPNDSLPADWQHLLLWGTSPKVEGGKQIDHVGRSNRTQQPRFDFLNTLSPADQVAAIERKKKGRERLQSWLSKIFSPLASLYEMEFAIRDYDSQPDVMIYRRQSPVGFPNGRLLTDDVAGLTCQWGDCVLQEVAYIESDDFPRKTVNDKAFLATFPYLAEPWPSTGHPTDHFHINWQWVGLVVALLIVAVVFYRRRKRRSR